MDRSPSPAQETGSTRAHPQTRGRKRRRHLAAPCERDRPADAVIRTDGAGISLPWRSDCADAQSQPACEPAGQVVCRHQPGPWRPVDRGELSQRRALRRDPRPKVAPLLAGTPHGRPPTFRDRVHGRFEQTLDPRFATATLHYQGLQRDQAPTYLPGLDESPRPEGWSPPVRALYLIRRPCGGPACRSATRGRREILPPCSLP
jgi:hypothetical protein